jgi:transposase
MAQATILPDPSRLHLLGLCADEYTITAQVTTTAPEAYCPLCQQRSSRVHSRYVRQVADLPWHGIALRLQLRVRRFFCANSTCQQTIFTERLPGLVASYARKTVRLAQVLEVIGLAVGGEAGARLLRTLGLRASPDTLLRLIQRAALPNAPTPEVLGVDDFAFRRGARYGTILVDLERHQTIDLLPDRTAETFASWLRQHPGVKVISRDRGGSYAEGGRLGAPDALQIADRFHVLKNLAESLDQILMREQRVLQAVAKRLHAPEPSNAPAPPPEKVVRRRPPRQLRDAAIRRERRQARYDAVIAAYQQGQSLHSIAQHQGLARATVRKYVRSEALPEQAPRRARWRNVDPFEDYLRERWNAGEQNSGALFRDLRAHGYTGSESTLRDYLSDWRVGPRRPGKRAEGGASAPAPEPRRTWTVRQTRWLLLDAIKAPSALDEAYRVALLEQSPLIQQAQTLVNAFFRLVRERQVEALAPWLVAAEQSGIPELVSFVQGIRRDAAAVEAALRFEWSQGQTEGKVNQLKFVKRSMYGRGKFDLLRQRLLSLPAS